MNDELFEQLPFKPTIYDMACYEALRVPIILKNGAEMYPKGWLRFLRLDESFLR